MTILCATDLLSRSNAAVDRAGFLADALGTSLSLLHVVPPVSSEPALMEELRLAGLQLKDRSQPPRWTHRALPNLLVRSGDPARVVIDTAHELKPELVVMGSRRRRTRRQGFKGSIVERLAQARRSPVLIVRRKPRGPYRSIVLALDLAQASAGAVRYAESLGIMGSVPRYTVLHAFEPPQHEMIHYMGAGMSWVDTHAAGWRREYRHAISDVLIAESRSPWRYDVVLEEGRAASVILKYVQRHEPDLLIMGTRAGGTIHRAFLGSVAGEVAHQARCDVLLVPQDVSSARRRSIAPEFNHDVETQEYGVVHERKIRRAPASFTNTTSHPTTL
jgi:nucleotide-binding universal stress UspA family protein